MIEKTKVEGNLQISTSPIKLMSAGDNEAILFFEGIEYIMEVGSTISLVIPVRMHDSGNSFMRFND